jgi:hypothetical protein
MQQPMIELPGIQLSMAACSCNIVLPNQTINLKLASKGSACMIRLCYITFGISYINHTLTHIMQQGALQAPNCLHLLGLTDRSIMNRVSFQNSNTFLVLIILIVRHTHLLIISELIFR